mgnify:CR=1 FL=1
MKKSDCVEVIAEKEKYAELNIEKGLLLPLISPEHRFCVQTNEEMEYLANKYSDTFYWCCNIDPRMGENNSKTDFSVFLEHYKKRGAKGMGELTANLYIDDPLIDNLMYRIGRYICRPSGKRYIQTAGG